MNATMLCETFDVFVERAHALERLPLAANGKFRSGFTLRAAKGEPVSLGFDHPDEESLRSYLLAFRPFVSRKEPVFVDRVVNLALQEIRSPELRDDLLRKRADHASSTKVGAIRVVVDSEEVGPARALDLWLNGEYFHLDREKRRVLTSLDPLGTVFSKHVMIDHVIDTSRYVMWCRDWIEFARAESLLP